MSKIIKREDVSIAMRDIGLSTDCCDSIERYLFDRIRTGGFLEALFSNDFMGAARRADHVNAASLYDWARFIETYMPRGSTGSGATVEAWLRNE